MKKLGEYILNAFVLICTICGVLGALYGIICICILLVSPDYEKGEYTLVYKVYYSNDNVKTYTKTNEWPISVSSNKGTNTIELTKEDKIFAGFRGETVFKTSAPIEIVSYKFKKTNDTLKIQ